MCWVFETLKYNLVDTFQELFDYESAQSDIDAQITHSIASYGLSGHAEDLSQSRLVSRLTDEGRSSHNMSLVINIEKRRDLFREKFRDQKSSESSVTTKKLLRKRLFGVFCTFPNNSQFLGSWGCCVIRLKHTAQLQVMGMISMGVIGSDLCRIADARNFQVHALPPLFLSIDDRDGFFYKTEAEAMVALDNLQVG